MQFATSSAFPKISQIIWFLRSEDDDVPSLSHLAEEAAAFLSFFLIFSSPFFSAANLIVPHLMLKRNRSVVNCHIQK